MGSKLNDQELNAKQDLQISSSIPVSLQPIQQKEITFSI